MAYLVFFSLVVGVARFFIPGHHLSIFGTYEAIAHILVGSLLTVTFCKTFTYQSRTIALICLTLITLIEVFMFTRFLHGD